MQTIATLIAVYGFHTMTPIGWGWAGFVWAYALIWALFTDPIKLLAYRIFDPVSKPAMPNKPRDAKAKLAPVPSSSGTAAYVHRGTRNTVESNVHHAHDRSSPFD